MLEPSNIVREIHSSGQSLVIALTGGGSGAISSIFEVPGASASMLEAIVPYSSRALQSWLGGPVDQYCSERTARAMAMRAYLRAQELSDADPHRLRGIGVTASLASNRPKRGDHRLHIAWQSATATATISCTFISGDKTRGAEEAASKSLILNAIGEACGFPAPAFNCTTIVCDIHRREQHALPGWSDLLLAKHSSVRVNIGDSESPGIIFPGAFNPPHQGHEQMAEIASRRLGGPVVFELSMTNVDKPPLDFLELADRLGSLPGKPVILTRAPTFLEKAELFPRCVFIVGADTIARISDISYYQGSSVKRDAAIARISELGCRFLVFGRRINGKFVSLSDSASPTALRQLCDEVPASEFDLEVSSSAIRQSTSD